MSILAIKEKALNTLGVSKLLTGTVHIHTYAHMENIYDVIHIIYAHQHTHTHTYMTEHAPEGRVAEALRNS